MAKDKGKLFLIPNVIAEHTEAGVLPPSIRSIAANLRYFLAEDIRTARRYLSSLKIFDRIEDLHFSVLDKDTSDENLDELMKPIEEGHSMGIISESGCPGVADPGSIAVRYAHEHNVTVVPLVGPSSLLLALMSSGLNGQRFAFHGYLPIDGKELEKELKLLERESRAKKQTQLFIETPYRNNNFFKALCRILDPRTTLCVALDLTGENELVKTAPVAYWKAQSIEWPKKPAIFLFLA